MSINKPLLAATIESPDDLDKLDYPVYVSPKLDGIRCITDENGVPFTRKGEPFANKMLNQLFASKKGWENLDGELGLGEPTAKDFFTKTSGAVRREDDPLPSIITFYVFDRVKPDMDFLSRWWANKVPENADHGLHLKWVPQIKCWDKGAVLGWEDTFVKQGYEGIMIRNHRKPYKHGRASMKSQELMKYKRFADDEGIIIDFEEAQTNNNEAVKDAFGHTKRSSAKAGKVGANRVGVIIVASDKFANPVRIGTGIGLTHELREQMWREPEAFKGRVVTFAYQAGSDYLNARFPSFKGFRDDGI